MLICVWFMFITVNLYCRRLITAAGARGVRGVRVLALAAVASSLRIVSAITPRRATTAATAREREPSTGHVTSARARRPVRYHTHHNTQNTISKSFKSK